MRKQASFKGKTILAIGAHPDDIDFSSSGTIINMVAGGAKAYLLILTNGNKGSSDTKLTKEKLVKIRRDEQKVAAKIIGFKEVFFLDHEDTELKADLRLKEEVVGFIRKLRPDIVFGWDPSSYYSKERGFVMHTDHREAGIATLDAVFPMARDRLTFQHLEDLGLKPHKVKTLYLINFADSTTYFDVTKNFLTKIKAIKAHKSQVGEGTPKMIKDWSAKRGKLAGYKYAEGFVKIDLPG